MQVWLHMPPENTGARRGKATLGKRFAFKRQEIQAHVQPGKSWQYGRAAIEEASWLSMPNGTGFPSLRPLLWTNTFAIRDRLARSNRGCEGSLPHLPNA